MSKLFTFMLNRRINEWAEEFNILTQAQFAYKPGYSTTDAIFVLHAVLSSSLESFNGACCGFIDFTKAFDKINRDILFKRLKQFHISAKLLNMIKNMYSKLGCQVRTSVGESDHFAQDNGVMQGECLSPTLFAAYINEIERLMNSIEEMGVYINGVKVSVIMYADDLVLIAKNRHGLQLGMNALHEYCVQNDLTVNTSKSQLMQVSRRKITNLPELDYNGSSLAWVDSFKYLGVNISRTNNLSKGLNAACQQARKAQKVLDMHIMNHSTVSLNHIFELFDSLIKPILMYGCAVWGYGAINEIEAYHLQFMKRTLGVKVTTNSCVVYAETGRFPLHIDINLCMIKYWIKILNSDVKKLIHVAYNTMLQHPEKYAWIKHIKDLLCCHGFGYIWNDQAVANEKTFINLFEQRIKDEFIQKCFNDIQISDRCRLYKEIKTVFRCESYMSCEIKSALRVNYTKLRLSSHKFLVERARWGKVKIPYAQRRCTLCSSGDIEDEYHMIMICEHFRDVRVKYIKPFYYKRPSMWKFVQLMNSTSKRDRFKLMLFLKITFKLYGDTL